MLGKSYDVLGLLREKSPTWQTDVLASSELRTSSTKAMYIICIRFKGFENFVGYGYNEALLFPNMEAVNREITKIKTGGSYVRGEIEEIRPCITSWQNQ